MRKYVCECSTPSDAVFIVNGITKVYASSREDAVRKAINDLAFDDLDDVKCVCHEAGDC